MVAIATRETTAIRYVVDVIEPRDPMLGMGGYSRRFTFNREMDAWNACVSANAAGFKARCTAVR